MEEILASIRRIIADDDGARPPPAPAAAKPTVVPAPVPALMAAADRDDVEEMASGFDDPQTPGSRRTTCSSSGSPCNRSRPRFYGGDAASDDEMVEESDESQDGREELGEPATPELAKPEPGRFELAKPELAKPELAKPELAKSEHAKPELPS